jgi:alpha-N-acetylglucosamine transferase
MEGATAATYDADIFEGSKGDDSSVSSSCKLVKTCDTALLSTTTTIPTTFDDIPSELLIQYILPFVGRHQYRFVATVDHNFHTAYSTVFPEKVTHFNVSTIEHVKTCFDEIMRQYHHPRILCHIAAREGNLAVLKYLRSIQCPWDSDTCASAAENGHLDVLQWCRENDCSWDAWTCSRAAINGHIDIFKWCRYNGCECCQYTCKYLERKGYYDVLQWSFKNGCVCIVCSKYGNLD